MNLSLLTISQMSIFADASVMSYFTQSNFAGQVIVIVLLILSVLAWGTMFCKNADLNAIDSANKNTQLKLSKSNSLQEAAQSKAISGPDAILISDAVSEWDRSGFGLDDSVESRSIRMGHVENALQRTLARQVIKCESKMTLLGTIISGAPFLGLLGTAWGVMDCFGSMSAQASVTLNDLAPGVAGALLTTVAGLVVAIPSVFGYNYLSTRTRKSITDMENFASLLADRLELESRARDLNTRGVPPQNFGQQNYQQSQPVQPVQSYVQQPQTMQPLTYVQQPQSYVQQPQSYVQQPQTYVQQLPAQSYTQTAPMQNYQSVQQNHTQAQREIPTEKKVIKFSIDDDDDDGSPAPSRDFEQ